MNQDLIFNEAFTYLERGYSPVPLPPKEKKPVVAGFSGKFGKMATLDDVKLWAVERPTANIALRLPDNVVAIDVDAINLETGERKNGVETMRAAIERWGKLPLIGRSSSSPKTPGHGHYLFRVPAGTVLVENLDKLVGTNVDILQHTHRYLVAPPSIHPATGEPYEWVPGDDYPDMVSFPPVENLPMLPDAWLEALLRPDKARIVQADGTIVEPEGDSHGVVGGSTEDYDAMDEPEKTMVREYVEARVDEILADLAALKDLPDGGRSKHGEGWHEGIRRYTMHLARLCNAPWSPLLPSPELDKRLKASMPHDAAKPLNEGLDMFSDGVDKPLGADYPEKLRQEITNAVFLEEVESVNPTEAPAIEVPSIPTPTATTPTCINIHDKRTWTDLEKTFGTVKHGAELIDFMAKVLKPWLQRTETSWMVWVGNRWVRDFGEGQPSQLLRSLMIAQPMNWVEGDPGEWELSEFSAAIREQASHSPKTILDKLAACSVLRVDTEFDLDPYKINTPNGLLDLTTGEVEKHSHEMLVTGMTRASYREGATHRDLSKVLDLHPKPVVDYLQEVLGAALTGKADHRLTLLNGAGGNGKTTLLGSLIAAMGSYAFAGRGSDLADIMANKSHKTVSAFEGKRLVLFEELAKEGYLDAATIKRLVGGGKQGGDPKYQAYREWDPTASVVINANSMPNINEVGASMKRRLRAIPMTATVPEAQQDQNIEERLRKEATALEAVFAWAVEGARRFIANGSVLRTPDQAGGEIASSTGAWVHDSDITSQFIESTLTPSEDPQTWIPLKEIDERFSEFWVEIKGDGVRRFTPKRLYDELRERGVEVYPVGKRDSATRTVTGPLLGDLDANAKTVFVLGQKTKPVRGWAFRDGGNLSPMSADDLLTAIDRQSDQQSF